MLDRTGPVSRLTSIEWVERCEARIRDHDNSLAHTEVADLARALAARLSCRALLPEMAADLLFHDRFAPPRAGDR